MFKKSRTTGIDKNSHPLLGTTQTDCTQRITIYADGNRTHANLQAQKNPIAYTAQEFPFA